MQIKVTSPGKGQPVKSYEYKFNQLPPELPLFTEDGKAYEGMVGEVVEGYEHWRGLCQIDGNDHGEWFWLTYNSDALTPEEWRDQGYKIQRAYLITPNVPVTNDKDVTQNTVNEGENKAETISKMETVEVGGFVFNGIYGIGVIIDFEYGSKNCLVDYGNGGVPEDLKNVTIISNELKKAAEEYAVEVEYDSIDNVTLFSTQDFIGGSNWHKNKVVELIEADLKGIDDVGKCSNGEYSQPSYKYANEILTNLRDKIKAL